MSESVALPYTYFADAIPDADAIFAELLENLPWHRRQIKLYGKLNDVPRDEVWIGKYPYRYSGHTYPAREWLPQVLPLRAIAEQIAGIEYNSVLINLYRDGSDKVAWHCDCEATMSKQHPICSVSLGATRKFQVRAREPKNAPIHSVDLVPGSVVLMHAGMQQDWFHQVPAQPKIKEPRINLTFRVMEG